MSVAYTSTDNVAAYLGQPLADDQQAWASTLIDAATDLIDTQTRRSWQDGSTTYTAEQHDLIRDWLSLRHAPVLTITTLKVRSRAVGDAGTTLVAGVDYELQDAQTGFVVLTQGYGAGSQGLAIDQYSDGSSSPGPTPRLNAGASEGIARRYALVTYTAQDPVPADVAHLATLLVAHWMRVNLHPERHEVEQIRAGDQMMVRYAMHAEGLPPDIKEMLRLRTRGGVFA